MRSWADAVAVVASASPDDLWRLRDIERAAGQRYRDFGPDSVADDEPASIEVLTGYADADRAWVAADGDDIPVGYILVDEVDGAGYIAQVSVLPDHQGHGAGRALIDWAGRWALGQGMASTRHYGWPCARN